jgi:hypothetical protein
MNTSYLKVLKPIFSYSLNLSDARRSIFVNWRRAACPRSQNGPGVVAHDSVEHEFVKIYF